jgi:hypothetical protein
LDASSEARLFGMLDALSLGVAKVGDNLQMFRAELRDEMRAGFERVDRRIGNLETHVERIENHIRLKNA